MHMINLQWTVDNQTQNQTINLEGDVIIGRSADSTISIPHQTVSRQHAMILVKDNQITLRNLSATNPIAVSGGKILKNGEETPLKTGDVFVLGHVNVQISMVEMKQKFSFKVKCTGCGKVVESHLTDCPWCGTSLAFGETFIGS